MVTLFRRIFNCAFFTSWYGLLRNCNQSVEGVDECVDMRFYGVIGGLDGCIDLLLAPRMQAVPMVFGTVSSAMGLQELK